jgi:hypothetical protein
MLKVLFRLLVIIIATDSSFAQYNQEDLLFIGHAYGSHGEADQQLDPALNKFINNNPSVFQKIILGGDFIYDCSDDIEIQNFNKFFQSNNVRFVLGNHENCDNITQLADKNFGGINYYEKINENLILYLNTSINSFEQSNDLYAFLDKVIKLESPKNILIFTHQLIFSKSDFSIRTNSRKYYEYGNHFYDKIFQKYNNSQSRFFFFSGDIGAYNFMPYAFYDTENNFEFYASGLGNSNYKKGILINVAQDINVGFIDLETGLVELPRKYSKLKVQIYQFPKLVLSHLKKFLFPTY